MPAPRTRSLPANFYFSRLFSRFSSIPSHLIFHLFLLRFSLVLSLSESPARGGGWAPFDIWGLCKRCAEAVKVPAFYMLFPLIPLGKTLQSNCSALIDSFSLSALNYLQR